MLHLVNNVWVMVQVVMLLMCFTQSGRIFGEDGSSGHTRSCQAGGSLSRISHNALPAFSCDVSR